MSNCDVAFRKPLVFVSVVIKGRFSLWQGGWAWMRRDPRRGSLKSCPGLGTEQKQYEAEGSHLGVAISTMKMASTKYSHPHYKALLSTKVLRRILGTSQKGNLKEIQHREIPREISRKSNLGKSQGKTRTTRVMFPLLSTPTTLASPSRSTLFGAASLAKSPARSW